MVNNQKAPTTQPAGKLWYRWPVGVCDQRVRLREGEILASEPYDVAIIGAGVVGCALAYELSQYHLRVILIEKANDVGEGTSKANSALVHTGFDATPGTLESQLVSSASRQWPQMAQKLKVPMLQTGAIVLAVSEEQAEQLPAIYQRAMDNGVDDVELIDAGRVKELEPHCCGDCRGGLRVPRESIIDPFGVSIAFAEIALANGVDILFGTALTRVEDLDGPIKRLRCEGDLEVRAKLLVNAAGLWSRTVADAYEGETFDVNPRRGQFLLYDKACRKLVNHILLPIPTKRTKGKLLAPTIFGNLLAGPTAEDLPPEAVEATFTTPLGLEEVRISAAKLCPELLSQPAIAAYAGLRCNCAQGNYLIRFNDCHPGIVTVTGVRSTGLTSSFMLARHLIQGMVDQCGLRPGNNPLAIDSRPDSSWPGWWKRPYDDSNKVAARPDYGRITCFCEQITLGEIQDALASPLRPQTLDALKRRTRVLMGRCQGFDCQVPLAEIMACHLRLPIERITKKGPGTELVAGGIS